MKELSEDPQLAISYIVSMMLYQVIDLKAKRLLKVFGKLYEEFNLIKYLLNLIKFLISSAIDRYSFKKSPSQRYKTCSSDAHHCRAG